MSIADGLALLANTKENLRLSLGLSKDVPFSQYASILPFHAKVGTVFDFVNNQYSKDQLLVDLSDISEFIRLSSATGWQDEQIVEVGDNLPRISGEGLLVEEQATNLFPHNNNIYISWPDRYVEVVGDSVVPEAFEIFCPGVDETVTGAINDSHYWGGSSPAGGIYHRFMLKQGNAKELRLSTANGTTLNWTPFEDLENAASSSRQIERIGEWFIITLLVSYSASSTGQGRYGLRLSVRDKVDEEKDLSLIMANYQVEREVGGDPIPSSYIPTHGTQATRAPDTLIVPLLPTQTLVGDWDEGVTSEIVDNIATFTGHGYIRNITVEAL